MPDYLIQPSADADDDLTNAIVIDDAADPLTNQGAVALGLTLGTNYKIRTLGAPATLNVAALPSSLFFADAIAGGDDPVASVDFRYSRTTTTLYGTSFISSGDSQSIDSDFSASMLQATKDALDAAGSFVAIYDTTNTGATTTIEANIAGQTTGIQVTRNSGNGAVSVDVDADTGGALDVSALYGQSAGTVWRLYVVWTQTAATRVYHNFNRLNMTGDRYRNCTVFERTQFDADDATMATEIAALDPRL